MVMEVTEPSPWGDGQGRAKGGGRNGLIKIDVKQKFAIVIAFLKCLCYHNSDRREARVVPEAKYPIGGIKNGISILFFYKEGE